MRIGGRLCETGELATITLEAGKILRQEAGLHALDLGGAEVWISAGFCDLQINGYAGYDFNVGAWGDSEEVAYHLPNLLDQIAKSGTALLCPTLTTNSEANLTEGLSRLARALAQNPALEKRIAGVHLEGPWIAYEDGPRGAHPKEHVREPDFEEFQRLQEASGGRIRLCTLAPERENALEFIERLTRSGVLVAIGHTGAEPERIREAVLAGAQMSTHLGNAAHGQIRRHPNYIWEQLAHDSLYASLILDGHHLPASVAKCMVRAKGADRVALVSDSVALAGLSAGRYMNGRYEVLETGKITLAGTPYLAGAGHLLDHCLANALRMTDLSLREVTRCASLIPARILGTEAHKGRLLAGYDADLTLFRLPKSESAPLEIVATICAGEKIYQKEGAL